jgi:uncharacterized membrane protein required for colicin V production
MGINIFVIIVALFLVFKIVDGYKKGMVKEIISFVSLIFLCVVVALIGNGVSSYHDGKVLNVMVVVVLLAVLSIVHHLINVVVFPAKLIAKLPIVHSLDKILGVVVGVLETVLIIWTIYSFTMMMDLGRVEEFILQGTAENPILTWFYEHNQLVGWLQALGARFRA